MCNPRSRFSPQIFLAVLFGMCLGISITSVMFFDLSGIIKKPVVQKPVIVDPSPDFVCKENGDTILPFFTPARVPKPKARIPRRLFTTGKTRAVGPAMCKSIRRLLNMNPEWDFYMFGDADIVAYLEHSNYKTLQPLYEIVATGAIRADLWRYLIIYDYGGVYFDIDSWTWAPLRDFIPEDVAVVTSSMTAGLLCQWALMYRPGHFIMSATAKEAFKGVLRVVTGEEDWKIHEYEWKEKVTGPPALSRAFERTSKLVRGRPEDKMIMYLNDEFGHQMRNRYGELNPEKYAKKTDSLEDAHWGDYSKSMFYPDIDRERFVKEKEVWMERIDKLFPDVESGPIVYLDGPETFITS